MISDDSANPTNIISSGWTVGTPILIVFVRRYTPKPIRNTKLGIMKNLTLKSWFLLNG